MWCLTIFRWEEMRLWGLITLHHGWTTTSLIFWIVFFTFRWHGGVNTVRIKYKLVKPVYFPTKWNNSMPCLAVSCYSIYRGNFWNGEINWHEIKVVADGQFRMFQMKYIQLTHRLYMFESVQQFHRMSGFPFTERCAKSISELGHG